MDIQAEKYTLIERIIQIKDSSLIARVKQFLAANESDFWEELDEDLKASIERGLSQSARGEVKSHGEVMKKYEKWL